jgi:hypothetical protein
VCNEKSTQSFKNSKGSWLVRTDQARREREIAKRTRMKIVQKASHPGLDLRVESGRCRAEFQGP